MNFYPFKAYIPISYKITNPVSFVSSIKDCFLNEIEAGTYTFFDQHFFYLYNIQWQGTESTALVALADPHSYKSEIIPHESTILQKKDVLLDAIMEEKVITKPIMTFSEDQNLKEGLLKIKEESTPVISLDLGPEGIHEVYQITNEESVHYLERLLSDISKVYVADGHHRLDSLYKISKEINSDVKFLLSVFPKELLHVRGYNRQIILTQDFGKDDIIHLLGQYGEVQITNKENIDRKKDAVYLKIEREFYVFLPQKDLLIFDSLKFESEFLDKIFFHTDIKLMTLAPSLTDPWYDQATADKAIFFLLPVTTDTIIAETQSGGLLPPKSTWFEPKVRSGLIAGKIFE